MSLLLIRRQLEEQIVLFLHIKREALANKCVFYDESEYFRHYNLTTHRYRYTHSNRNRSIHVYSPNSCFKITVFVV